MSKYFITVFRVDGRKKPPYTRNDVIENWPSIEVTARSWSEARRKAEAIAKKFPGTWITFR
jgi:hypothetical protein